jgi:cytoskeletal protein RodZ
MSSFGEEMKRERELREFTLREVSESTKISLRHLEALERNDFEQLPGGVFNRGFVRAYAQFIGVDPEAMVNAYLLEEQALPSQSPGQDRYLRRRNEPGPQRPVGGQQEAAQSRRPRGKSILWVGALLVVVAAAIAGWWLLAGS